MAKGIIPKKIKVEKIKINLNISKELDDEIKLYSKFLEEEDTDYIVEELLKIALKKDKDFKNWKSNKENKSQEKI